MKDRVPVNPGRVLVTPENGGAAYYATLTRADNPTQEGTPLNKASLLKDATAALFGLGADAVPDDALALLSRFQNGLGNEYVWLKTTGAGSYVDAEILGYVNSPYPNAYPVDDGYTYTALGQLGAAMTKIQPFSYAGTGVYGANNPNTLTFDFPVTLLAMLAVGSEQMDCSDQYRSYAKFLLVSAMPTEYTSKAGLGYPTANSYGKRSDDYKTVYWYHLGGAADQFNQSGLTYYGFAIG